MKSMASYFPTRFSNRKCFSIISLIVAQAVVFYENFIRLCPLWISGRLHGKTGLKILQIKDKGGAYKIFQIQFDWDETSFWIKGSIFLYYDCCIVIYFADKIRTLRDWKEA